jgi:hypothetical protein
VLEVMGEGACLCQAWLHFGLAPMAFQLAAEVPPSKL